MKAITQLKYTLENKEIMMRKMILLYNNFINRIHITILRRCGVTIGKNCYIDRHINIDRNIIVGSNVTISSHLVILGHDASTKKFIKKTRLQKTIIGNNCFIGMHAIILPGITIGQNSIVGANSVVTHNIPANSVCVGNPANIVSSTEEFIKKHTLLMVKHPELYIE